MCQHLSFQKRPIFILNKKFPIFQNWNQGTFFGNLRYCGLTIWHRYRSNSATSEISRIHGNIAFHDISKRCIECVGHGWISLLKRRNQYCLLWFEKKLGNKNNEKKKELKRKKRTVVPTLLHHELCLPHDFNSYY